MDLATEAAIASMLVALLATCVAVFAANFSRKQAEAAKLQAEEAKRQADAAEVQATTAREQADASWAQVDEARTANQIANEQRAARYALEAVRWTATAVDLGGLPRIEVRNLGTETAFDVEVSGLPHGRKPPAERRPEVTPGEYVPVKLALDGGHPRQVYVNWRGAPHPRAVVVEVEK